MNCYCKYYVALPHCVVGCSAVLIFAPLLTLIVVFPDHTHLVFGMPEQHMLETRMVLYTGVKF